MKAIFTFLIALIFSGTIHSQSTQFEFKGPDNYYSQHLLVDGDDIYFSFSSDSQFIYSTYIAKWNTKTEKIQWCKKLSVNLGVSIHPVKILARKDDTFVLGAYDYSWKDGFMNGNYTFIQFDKNGQIVQSKRLGSPNGGNLRDAVIDEDDSIIFSGDRINALSEYRIVVGRMDKNFNVVRMRSVFKDYYTYGLALQKDRDGNIYTAGHTQPSSFGFKRSIATKWSENLDHITTIMNLDEDPNTTFNYIHIDDENQIHLGGNLGNLAKYVRLNKDFEFEYGHEFNFGFPRNIWKDENGHTNIFIEGANYFVRLDKNNEAQQYIRYGLIGNTSGQIYNQEQKRLYNISYYNTEDDPKNRMYITSHTYNVDNECFLYNRSGDFNGPLRKDSFGITNVIIKDEIMTAVVPDDIIVSDYNLSVREICRMGDISSTTDRIQNNVKIYPSPAQDYIHIDFGHSIIPATVAVYNMQGMLQPVKSESDGRCNISQLTNGMYVLRIQDVNNKVFISKFQVIR